MAEIAAAKQNLRIVVSLWLQRPEMGPSFRKWGSPISANLDERAGARRFGSVRLAFLSESCVL
jgi:hypothetical protein